VLAGPVHPLADGVTVIVAVTGFGVTLVAVNEAMLPVPEAGIPMVGSELVHAKVAPGVALVNPLAATVAPAHNEILAGTVTVGIGFTVMV
jgi:hypothetical protein